MSTTNFPRGPDTTNEPSVVQPMLDARKPAPTDEQAGPATPAPLVRDDDDNAIRRAPGLAQVVAESHQGVPVTTEHTGAALKGAARKRKKTRGRTSSLKLTERGTIVSQMKEVKFREPFENLYREYAPAIQASISAQENGELPEDLRDGFLRKLQLGLKQVRFPKSREAIEHLKASGMDRALVKSIARGKLTEREVNQILSDFSDELRKNLAPEPGTKPLAEVIKSGIVAFDEAGQRLSLVSKMVASAAELSPESYPGPSAFEYSPDRNGARDKLVTYARSLHR